MIKHQVALDFVKATAEKDLGLFCLIRKVLKIKNKRIQKLLDNGLILIRLFALFGVLEFPQHQILKRILNLVQKMVVEVYAGRFGDYKGKIRG